VNKHHFISYSRTDGEALALRLYDAFANGTPPIDIWLDQYCLLPGIDWDDQVVDAIQWCKTLIFVGTHDSVERQSICKKEWRRALKYKKPVIPLLGQSDIEMPFLMDGWHYIDFTRDFEQAVEKLRKHLLWLNTPEGELFKRRVWQQNAIRDEGRSQGDAERKRAEQEIKRLEREIEELELTTKDPETAKARTLNTIKAGLERERRAPNKEDKELKGRIINTPPATPPSYFQDRYFETKMLGMFLADNAKCVFSVIGRGGVGKTAMVCRVLLALEHNRLPDNLGEMDIDSIIYYSATGTRRITVHNICDDIISLLSDDVGANLRTFCKDERIPPRERMLELLKVIPLGRIVLLLDNLEEVTDLQTRRLTNQELMEILQAVLQTPHHNMKVIITSRIPLVDLPAIKPERQASLFLDKGLESPFAENILREMDADGTLGLRNAPEELLTEARELTRGYPRALEALYASLVSDRDTSLQELLDDTKQVLPENVIETLVGEAYNRLDSRTQLIIQALAIYSDPVPPVAVDYLLQPFESSVNSAPILSRLINMGFAHKELNTGRYYLHPVDISYALGRVSADNTDSSSELETGKYTIHTLRIRARDYYRQIRKTRANWKSIADLDPQLAEFEQSYAVEDYISAADVAFTISGVLLLWGNYQQMVKLYQRLLDCVEEPEIRKRILLWLARAYRELGRIREAILLIEEAIKLSQKHRTLSLMPNLQNTLGMLYDDLGDSTRAIALYRQVIKDHTTLTQNASTLSNLGLTYAAQGQAARGILYSLQAVELSRLKGERNNAQISMSNVAHYLIDAGRIDQAIHLLHETVKEADDIGSRQGQHHNRFKLGQAFLLKGDLLNARLAAEQALDYDLPENKHRVEAFVGIVALNQGDRAVGRDHFLNAIDCANRTLVHTPRHFWAHYAKSLAYAGLALSEGDRHVENAIKACHDAMTINDDDGNINRFLRFLDSLCKVDENDILLPVRQALDREPAEIEFALFEAPGFAQFNDPQADLAHVSRPTSLKREDWVDLFLQRSPDLVELTERFHQALKADPLLDETEFQRFVSSNEPELGDLRIHLVGLIELIAADGDDRRMFLTTVDGSRQLAQIAKDILKVRDRPAPQQAREFLRHGYHAAWDSRTIKDREGYLSALKAIKDNYYQAYDIDPDDGEIRASIVEINICLGHAGDAADLAEKLLPTTTVQPWRGLFHWLGAIACILDRRPADQWRNALEELNIGARSFGGRWHPDDIDKYLKEFAKYDVPDDRIADAIAFHESVKRLRDVSMA